MARRTLGETTLCDEFLEPEPPDADAVPICANCAHELPDGVAYCPNCGIPAGQFSSTDPMQAIHSTGWGYRRAASGRTTALMFWGMWLVFGPAAAGIVAMFIDVLRHDFLYTLDFPNALGLLLAIGIGVLYIAVLIRVTRNYIRHRRYKAGLCGNCHYSLRGLTGPRCPECGEPFDPELLDLD